MKKNIIEKKLKSIFKNKIKLSKSFIIAFLILGYNTFSNIDIDNEVKIINIEINNYNEEKGLELGNNGISRGRGSITTGNNNIAIGTNSVATGGNESNETINQKINENKIKLNEIERQKNKIINISKELEKLKIRNKSIIEAANRVNALNISKKNLLKEYNRLKNERITLEENSKSKLIEFNNKINDLNERLGSLANIENINISSEEGLREAVIKFKSEVEKDSTLNLSTDFYKEYITNYYKVLGEMRKNEKIANTSPIIAPSNAFDHETNYSYTYSRFLLNNYNIIKIKSGAY